MLEFLEDHAQADFGIDSESAKVLDLGAEDGDEEEVEFKVWDVLGGSFADIQATPTPSSTSPSDPTSAGWDVVLDKGTFDAISLSDEKDSQGRRICEGYGERVLQLLRVGGIFLVTSCNWTETELREWFENKTKAMEEEGARLKMAGRIAYPSFSFGGVKGQTISTLCFEKVVA
ncbi:Protein-lysine N-methyltransferase efm4 [Collariella sp. IMI 366227]|nr:Protein-lysine N-methyltransferase efm4 [Collariella sp. IMI 366227]